MDLRSEEYPIIKIENLYKTFYSKDGEVNALKDINLEINKGEIYGIIGMSGAGKSTLVRCINYLEKPTKGRVLISGKDLSVLSDKELREVRHSIGMIFQQFNLLMQDTVIKNVMFPLEITGMKKEDAQRRALELLDMVGLSEKANAYPAKLSGGQKQRVAIARALASNPSVLLCDEATSALDPNTTSSILELLKGINQKLGITIVIITHEMSVVEEICTHVAVIENSMITETGSVEEIFTHPKSNWARNTINPDSNKMSNDLKSNSLRIVFDGSTTHEPVISDMILELGIKVSILYANVKDIEGKALGQIVIEIPKDEEEKRKVMEYLNRKNLVVERMDK